jgi:multidrug efflux pump subunit AcrA (membrane-fusion protein)
MNFDLAKVAASRIARISAALVFGHRRVSVAVVMAAIALLVIGRGFSSSGVQQAVVRKGALTLSVPFSGVLKADDSDRLGPPQVPRVWRYKISMMAPEGQVVKVGSPVLGFDTSDLQKELDAKLAESETASSQMEKMRAQMEIKRQDGILGLAEAEANLRKAKMQSDIPPGLQPENKIRGAQLDVELYTRQIESLKASQKADMASFSFDLASQRRTKERALARLAEIRAAMERMTVLSPRDGTVIYITSEDTQQKKQIGDECWVGEKVLEVANLDRMSGEGQVDESDISLLAIGERARLRLDAHPDEELSGTVRSVGQALEAKSPANPLKVVKVEVKLDETDPRRMMPGMRFTGFIEAGLLGDALLIPPDAVTETPAGATARVKSFWGWRTVKIKLGERGKEMVQVLAGLREGDVLARRGAEPGAKP